MQAQLRKSNRIVENAVTGSEAGLKSPQLLGNQSVLGSLAVNNTENIQQPKPVNLDAAMRQRMQRITGYDLSGIKMTEDSAAEERGFAAVAQGNTISFAPGKFDQGSAEGRKLIGHEIAHVVQQATGRTPATGKRVLDASLERDADRVGEAGVFAYSASEGGLSGIDSPGMTEQGGAETAAAMPAMPVNASAQAQPLTEDEKQRKRAAYTQYGGMLGENAQTATFDGGLGRQSHASFLTSMGMRSNDPRAVAQKQDLKGLFSAESVTQNMQGLMQRQAGNRAVLGNAPRVSEWSRASGKQKKAMDSYSTSMFDMALAMARQGVNSESGKMSMRLMGNSLRGSTSGKQGEQDYFGNDVNTSELMTNSLMLNALMPKLSVEGRMQGGNEHDTKAAQNSLQMMNFFGSISRDLGGEVDQKKLKKMLKEQVKTNKDMKGLLTVENFMKYRGLSDEIGALSRAQDPDAPPPQPAPQPQQQQPQPSPTISSGDARRQTSHWFDDAEEIQREFDPATLTAKQRGLMAYRRIESLKGKDDEDSSSIRQHYIQEYKTAKDEHERSLIPQQQQPQRPQKKKWQFWK